MTLVSLLKREKKTFHFRSDFVRNRAESAFRQGIENRFARESSFIRQKRKRQKNKTHYRDWETEFESNKASQTSQIGRAHV